MQMPTDPTTDRDPSLLESLMDEVLLIDTLPAGEPAPETK